MTGSPLLGPLPEAPTISVISTVYQHERFLARMLDSVLAQDWPHERLEWILVNDGSTDGSRAILDDYAARHACMRVIHQENGGLKAAINRAIGETTGDLVRAVSGDDMLPPGALRAAAEHLVARPHVGLLYTDMTVIDDDDRVVAPSFMRENGKEPFTGRPLGELLSANFVSSGSVMLRGALKDVVHPLPDEAAWEDYWWAWRVAQVADLDYLDRPTYLYRSHGSNMSYGLDGERQARAYVDELRFRRFMLSTVEPGQVSATWAMRGWGQLLRMGAMVGERLRQPVEKVFPVTDVQRAEAADEAAAALQAAGRGEIDLAAVRCVRALGRDPHRDDMVRLARGLHDSARSTAPVTAAAEPQLGALRGLVVLADADELVACPDLLRTYGDVIGADDDVTLVIHAAGWAGERIGGELVPLLDAAGMNGDPAPDIVAHAGPVTDRAALLRRAHVRLTARTDTAHPHVGAGDGDALRARAEARRAATAV